MPATAPFTRVTLALMLTFTLACGTLLYPERRGMEDADRLDPVVILLDGALLLVFIVPGVVAFAVDISTGAIYEPEEGALVRHQSASPFALTIAQAERLSGARDADVRVWWETVRGNRAEAQGTLRDRDIDIGQRPPSLEAGVHHLVIDTAHQPTRRVAVTLE